MFDITTGLKQFRMISKKFYTTFDKHLIHIITEVPRNLKQYSEKAITDCKEEMKNAMTIVDRINKNGKEI